jgi:hypothetical protein
LPAGADVALCFQLMGHLLPEQRIDLLTRMRAAVRPGGTLAVLDHFAPAAGRDDAGAFVALNYFLVSRTPRSTVDDMTRQLMAAGWPVGRRIRIRRMPGQTLLVSRP